MKQIYLLIFTIVGLLGLSFSADAQPIDGPNGQGTTSGSRQRRNDAASVLTTAPIRDIPNVRAMWQILCRGGEGFTFTPVDSQTHSSGAVMTTLELGFSPAPQAAGANAAGLQPGQCARVSHGFNIDELGQVREPLKIRFVTPANAQLKQTQSGSAVDRSSTAAENYPDVSSIARYLQSPNRYWIFHDVRNKSGYFETSSHGHWKKRLVTNPNPNRYVY
jgi:hypothetical protein